MANRAALAHEPPVFLHCRPAHYGQECTERLVHGPQSLVFEEAENRLWAQMAVPADLLGLADEIAPLVATFRAQAGLPVVTEQAAI